MRIAVWLSIDQGELVGGHSGVEAGGRKGRGSDDESSEAQLPKSKATVRNEVDSEEHQCRRGGSTDREGRDADASQRIVGWAWQHHDTAEVDFRGVIDPLLSWRESIGCKRG
ncbi:hypothetical protein BHM03_00054801 [Ensete ventricosum]|nr:hypothetical protein BHM03_00054801 [Ensete ventricosum]